MELEKFSDRARNEMDELQLLLVKKNKEKKELETIIDAIESKMVGKVRGMYIPWSGEKLELAFKQQNEKLKKDRPIYEAIKGNLRAWLFEPEDQKKVKLTKIIPYGYGHEVYNLVFTFEGIKFELKVPNVSVCCKGNIADMNHGQYALLWEVNNSHWQYIDISYDLDDISKSIYEFVKEKKGEKGE